MQMYAPDDAQHCEPISDTGREGSLEAGKTASALPRAKLPRHDLVIGCQPKNL